MRQDDQRWIDHIAQGGKIGPEDDLSPGYRAELTRLLVTFTDSELAGAAGFAEFINKAPSLQARITLARVISEKYEHAASVLDLLARFGPSPGLYVGSHAWSARLDRSLDLGNLRTGSDRRLNIFHYPLENWQDVAVLIMLMGTATVVQLEDQRDCSYAPFSDLLDGIIARESSHAAAGRKEVQDAALGHASPLQTQAAVDYWYPRVAATFGRLQSERLDLYRKFGLRKKTNAELMEQWKVEMKSHLGEFGLSVPT